MFSEIASYLVPFSSPYLTSPLCVSLVLLLFSSLSLFVLSVPRSLSGSECISMKQLSYHSPCHSESEIKVPPVCPRPRQHMATPLPLTPVKLTGPLKTSAHSRRTLQLCQKKKTHLLSPER